MINKMPSSSPKIGLPFLVARRVGWPMSACCEHLLEHGIPIHCIAGTSAGSIVGGAFASGLSIDEIADFGRKLRWRHIGRITMSRFGVQSNARLEQYLRERLPVTKFEDLPIPFAAVATDLNTAEAVVMKDKATCRLRSGRAARFLDGMCR